MKSKYLISILVQLLCLGSIARTPLNTAGTYHAEIETTSALIHTWFNEMVSKPIPAQYKIADYRQKSVEFNKTLGEALTRYEAALNTQILPPVMAEVDLYNRIYRSNQFDPEQKKRNLELVFQRLQKQAVSSSLLMQKEIGDLLLAVDSPDLIFQVSLHSNGNDRGCAFGVYSPNKQEFVDYGHENCNENMLISWDRLKSRLERDKESKELKSKVYEKIVKGCRSELCITLRAHDMAKTIGFIVNQLNKNISIKSLDGRSVSVGAIDLLETVCRRGTFRCDEIDISKYKITSTPPFNGDNQNFFNSTDFPIQFPQDTE